MLTAEPFRVQARQVHTKLVGVVEAAGLHRNQIAKVTAHSAGVEHWPSFDTIYAKVMVVHRPARAVVPVLGLHHGYLNKVQTVAVR